MPRVSAAYTGFWSTVGRKTVAPEPRPPAVVFWPSVEGGCATKETPPAAVSVNPRPWPCRCYAAVSARTRTHTRDLWRGAARHGGARLATAGRAATSSRDAL